MIKTASEFVCTCVCVCARVLQKDCLSFDVSPPPTFSIPSYLLIPTPPPPTICPGPENVLRCNDQTQATRCTSVHVCACARVCEMKGDGE